MTFTGSVIALPSSTATWAGPHTAARAHLLNLAIAAGIVVLIALLVASRGEALWAFWGVFALACCWA
jgi:NAD(P) transhydrogenase subunit beta